MSSTIVFMVDKLLVRSLMERADALDCWLANILGIEGTKV